MRYYSTEIYLQCWNEWTNEQKLWIKRALRNNHCPIAFVYSQFNALFHALCVSLSLCVCVCYETHSRSVVIIISFSLLLFCFFFIVVFVVVVYDYQTNVLVSPSALAFTRLVRNSIRQMCCALVVVVIAIAIAVLSAVHCAAWVCVCVCCPERDSGFRIQKQFSHSKSDKYGWKCLSICSP